MNKRIKKKIAKGRPVTLKPWHTGKQAAYRVRNALRKKGYTYHGTRIGGFSMSGDGQEQTFKRTGVIVEVPL